MNQYSQGSPVLILQGLNNKYEKVFNQFRKTVINYLFNEIYHSIDVIQYKDVACWSKDTEQMRRFYYLKDNIEECEIRGKLRRLTRIYGQNSFKLMGYEYPTMFLTSTEHIFFTRRQRLRRMRAIDLSQEVSQEQSSTNLLYSSQDFPTKLHILKIRNQNSFQSSLSMHGCMNSQCTPSISYDSDDYDIYQGNNPQKNENTKNENLSQNDFKQLIIDFNDQEEQLDIRNLSESEKFTILSFGQKSLNPELYESKCTKNEQKKGRQLYGRHLKRIGSTKQETDERKSIKKIVVEDILSGKSSKKVKRGKTIREKALQLLYRIQKASPDKYVFEHLDP